MRKTGTRNLTDHVQEKFAERTPPRRQFSFKTYRTDTGAEKIAISGNRPAPRPVKAVDEFPDQRRNRAAYVESTQFIDGGSALTVPGCIGWLLADDECPKCGKLPNGPDGPCECG